MGTTTLETYEKLDQDIWLYYEQNKQNQLLLDEAKCMQKQLKDMFGQTVDMIPFGSSISGLATKYSDYDICLLINGETRAPEIVLRYVYNVLSSKLKHRCERVQLITKTNVPIIKIKKCQVGSFAIDIDINFNKTDGIRMTHLLWYYNQINERFSALVVLLKNWTAENNFDKMFSSTVIALMVLHFLQCRNCPLLPNLQLSHEALFSFTIPVKDLVFDAHLISHDENNKVTTNMGNLLIEFLEYFCNKIDVTKCLISIKRGSVTERARQVGVPMFIECPFKKMFNIASGVSEAGYRELLKAFRTMLYKLQTNSTLQSIM